MRGACASLALMMGCASAPPPAPPQQPAPLTVAVIEFGDSGREAEDGCVMAALEAGFRVVSRREIAAALPNDDSIDYRKLGQQLKADLIIDGGLARGMKVRKQPPPRIVSTASGNLLAETRMHGRIDKSFKVGQKACSDLLNQLP
jgi:TolB-like protein